MFQSKITRYTLWGALIYASTTLVVMYVSDYIIFPAPEPTYAANNPQVEYIRQGDAIVASRYMPVPEAKYTILYSHGNRQDLGLLAPVMQRFNQQGYSVFAYDYRGYGHSNGTATETHAKQDIRLAYEHLTESLGVAPESIILYGYSLGSGVTMDLAKEKVTAGVIVEGAFTSTYRTKIPIKVFPIDRFDSYAVVSQVTQPILYLHGEDDSVIPVSHSHDLYHRTTAPSDIVTFSNHGHSSLTIKNSAEYWEIIQNWIDNFVETSETQHASN
ncbi:MAG: alpha/beta hydrolase [Legionellales bacterium]|nr:alpha/beta hydrolase [Legionellales bacterium]|tara:strand:+ start:3885 stop:4700 length:816 start_codon:yes stop_codon:yes gene_type:complete